MWVGGWVGRLPVDRVLEWDGVSCARTKDGNSSGTDDTSVPVRVTERERERESGRQRERLEERD